MLFPMSPPPLLTDLAERLHRLAAEDIYLGTSSWKYAGWLGQVYDKTRYLTRGTFSKRKFEQTCLEEYSQTFPTVCGDFVFYQFPSESMWQQTFAQLPDDYAFSLKIPEDITVERFPQLPRYGPRAGQSNGHFMDATLLKEKLLEPLTPYRKKLGTLIFEFGTIHDGRMSNPKEFSKTLDGLLSVLPTSDFQFAVEVRNPQFLTSDYLSCLRTNGVAHCLNSWTRMPSLEEQMNIEDIITANHVVARCLLKPGRTYAQAVEQFKPYDHIRDPYLQGRDALIALIEMCRAAGNRIFAFVNNRFEGSAVESIDLATRLL